MDKKLTSVAVFCGAAEGKGEKYMQLAAALGAECARRNVTIYYGGAKLGMMSAVANASLKNGGKVIGIVPRFFSNVTVVAQNITQLTFVDSMSERKQQMEKLADAFVILPGAFGTMDELFEVLTDAQLGFHSKPIVVLNQYGYYDLLQQQVEKFREEGFLRPFHYSLLAFASSVEDVFNKIEHYQYGNDSQWVAEYTANM